MFVGYLNAGPPICALLMSDSFGESRFIWKTKKLCYHNSKRIILCLETLVYSLVFETWSRSIFGGHSNQVRGMATYLQDDVCTNR